MNNSTLLSLMLNLMGWLIMLSSFVLLEGGSTSETIGIVVAICCFIASLGTVFWYMSKGPK